MIRSLFQQYRLLSFSLFALVTLGLGWFASGVEVSSDFKKLLPLDHPYLVNMMEHKDDLTLGNDIRIVVQASSDTIFSKNYFEWIQELTHKIYELPGVEKAFIKTIWTPNARWIAVTKDGFQGGELIPTDFNGSQESLDKVRENILRSSEVGRLVEDDFKSTSLYVPLTWNDSEGIDYKALNEALEALRTESEQKGYPTHIIGVSKKIGDLIEGARQMAGFFVAAVCFIFIVVMLYTKSVVIATVLALSGLCGVIWQLGLVSLIGRYVDVGLDPYSMLVPFLVFAISISHGLQLYNAAASDTSDECAGWNAFLQLRKPAALALGSDAIGFASLAIIPIAAIRDLALTASLGVLCLFVTTLFFIPLVISHIGVSPRFKQLCHRRALSIPFWGRLSLWSMAGQGRVLVGFLAIGVLGLGVWQSQDLQIGDLREGAPELRPDSQYNQDIAYFVEHYSQSVDVYVIMVRTPSDHCNAPEVLQSIETLQWQLMGLAGVQSTFSLADGVKLVNKGLNEGFPKWAHVPLDQVSINGTTANLPAGFMNLDCSFSPIYVFLKDHKAATLTAVTAVVKAFDSQLQQGDLELRTVPAAGNAGIEAAVNESIAQQQILMLVVIYGVVFLMCLLTFRRLSVVFAILLPLAMTSLLCQALMAAISIGVKVSTLPVIALGVGIGVDYGVYICARYLQVGDMSKVLADTGRIVFFTGLALAISVGSWMFSAIQFQADMGILLTFMFLWNMVGALVLLPFLLGFAKLPPKA